MATRQRPVPVAVYEQEKTGVVSAVQTTRAYAAAPAAPPPEGNGRAPPPPVHKAAEGNGTEQPPPVDTAAAVPPVLEPLRTLLLKMAAKYTIAVHRSAAVIVGMRAAGPLSLVVGSVGWQRRRPVNSAPGDWHSSAQHAGS